MNPRIILPRAQIIGRRHDYLVGFCAGKRILHIGCVDSGLQSERLRTGAHLHQLLTFAADTLAGIDLDADGIEEMRTAGFSDLIVGDVCDPRTLDGLDARDFDVVLASEVVEHLSDPGAFLRSLCSWMAGSKAQLVVTVPNAFRIRTLIELWRGIEFVHPDHNYWFSYVTIKNVLEKSGFSIDDIAVYTNESTEILPVMIQRFRSPSGAAARQAEGVRTYLRRLPRRLLARTLFRRTAFWGDGIVAIAHPATT